MKRKDRMKETQWNRKEVKRLKTIQLIQNNLVMLLFFILFGVYGMNGGTPTGVIGFGCVLLWIFTAHAIYTLLTGKMIGTKAMKGSLAFDIDQLGKKRWKGRKLGEVIFFLIVCLGSTVILFTVDINSTKVDFPLDAIPIMGGWLGTNIGQIIRIKKLS